MNADERRLVGLKYYSAVEPQPINLPLSPPSQGGDEGVVKNLTKKRSIYELRFETSS